MMDIKLWLLIFTDNLNVVLGKTFLGLYTSIEDAKKYAEEWAKTHFADYHITEINRIWCIEGREPDSDTFSYIVLHDLVKKD